MTGLNLVLKGSLLFVFAAITGLSVNAQVAQFRGPNRDGIFPDTALLKEWPEGGPKVLFVTEGLGKGFSSTVATKDLIFVTGTKDSTEYLTAMDHQGKIIWQKPYGRSFTKSYPDARCTPTVDGDRIYVLTGMDRMTCFQAKTGKEVWSVDLHEKYSSSWDMFGVSESLLIVGDMIITTPCGKATTVIALNKMNGELIWKSPSLDVHRSNLSPIVIDHCGKKYFITANQTHVMGVDVENGTILWTYHYNFLDANGENATILANTPVYRDSCLWISNGWDTRSVMLRIAPDGKSVSEEYSDQTFDNQNMGVVAVDGFVYGSNFTGRQTGKWVCMNWKTGEIVWIADFYNKGPIIYADSMLYCLEEKRGNMALVKADPNEFKVTSTFRVQEGKGPYWARPAIFFGMLLVRHGDVLVAYDIRRK